MHAPRPTLHETAACMHNRCKLHEVVEVIFWAVPVWRPG